MKQFIPSALFRCKALLILFVAFVLSKQSYAQFDFCATPTTLTTNTGCATVYTLKNATATAGVPGSCGNALSADVWFKYTPTTPYPIITINSFGSSFQAAGATIQLLSGASCATLTSLACTTAGVAATSLVLTTGATPGGAGLTVGTAYYIRILMATNTGATAGASSLWNFSICVTNPTATAASIKYGKSYVNITKGISGGTIEPGDTLEMRTNILVSSNIAYNVSVTGTIPAGTTYVTNSLNLLTNEAQLYKHWTDGADGDPGTIAGSNVTINVGVGATGTTGGMASSSDRPTLFGSQYLVVVVYRVVVNAVAYGTTISNVTAGSLSYSSPAGVVSNISFPVVNAMVYKNNGICANTVGSNGILSESGGTFGSGTVKDRAASIRVPANYTYTAVASGAPGDNFYSVSNNSSPGGANFSNNPSDPVAAHHVFNVWDIIGDHTGAASPTAGNPATTTATSSGGYMVIINAAFSTDTAFLDTVKNLCPNTYYEYSAWFRNICKKCSGDSTGKQPNTAGYIPTVAGPVGSADSSGVHPNLTYNVNGFDYYTTGDMAYTGQWVKKGFTYLTGPAETQMIVNIRNNAPGGGGNDWAIDDIGVATCTPNLALNPSTPTVNVCYGDGTSLSANVQSYFNNYVQYIWEKSTDNGATWTSTGFSGTGSPTLVSGQYQYTATGPSFIGDSTTHNNIYRLRVASTSANLADPNCSFAAVRTVKVYVNNCNYLLKADLVSISGSIKNSLANIQWQTVNETDKTGFEIERSTDGIHFNTIAKIKSNGVNGNGSYSYDDPIALTEARYYRIKMTEAATFKYSKIILLSPSKLNFTVKNLVNPFSNSLSFDVILPSDGDVRATVLDNFGRVVKVYTQKAGKGITALKIEDMNGLSSGVYALKVEWQNESLVKRIIKTNY